MTMLDKLRAEHPEFIGDQFRGGVAICPEDIGLEKKSECLALKAGNTIERGVCLRCWDREVQEK